MSWIKADTIEDFLENESFRRWVKGERPADKAHWEAWLLQNPGKRKLYETAVATLLALEDSTDSLTDEVIVHRVHQLRERFSQPQTPVYQLPVLRRLLQIAAVLVVGIGLGWLLLTKSGGRLTDPAKADLKQTLVATENRQQKKLQLEDGSVVWLNDASSLRFPVHFDSDRRAVTLVGEAYFEVQKDAKRPFIVHCGAIETRVLGTSFNVEAYAEDASMQVTVLTGKVKVTTSDKKATVQLTPNQQATYTRSAQSLTKETPVNAQEAIGWQQGKLRFRDVPFQDVVARLQRAYGVQIIVDKSFGQCLVHADFDRTEDIGAILNKLLVSLNGNVAHPSGNLYQLSGRGCF